MPPAMVAAIRCPDCDADVTMVESAPGIWQAEVAHDDTCPWWLDYQARGDAGVRLR